MGMTMRARAAVLATVAALLLPATAATGADEPETIVGSDGATYSASPSVVAGRNGELFYGRSFDLFCADGSGNFARSMDQLARLAKVIRRSGKRAVFLIAPDKAHVLGRNLVRSELPHGACDRRGIKAHGRLLDAHPDRSHLPIRKALAQDKRRIYWKTDTHWTTVGAAIYAKALATALDPALGARQKYKRGKKITALGPMAYNIGSDEKETVPTLRPAGGVKVRTARGSLDLDDGDYVVDHSWVSSPAGRTWPGRTVLLGDSFTFIALENLRPVFRKGRFLWVGNIPQAEINKAVAKADTVVIEVAQFFATVSQLTTDSFRTSIRAALR
jgi:hypothetical protein